MNAADKANELFNEPGSTPRALTPGRAPRTSAVKTCIVPDALCMDVWARHPGNGGYQLCPPFDLLGFANVMLDEDVCYVMFV